MGRGIAWNQDAMNLDTDDDSGPLHRSDDVAVVLCPAYVQQDRGSSKQKIVSAPRHCYVA